MTQTLEQLLEAVDKSGYRVFLFGDPLGQGWVLDAVHKSEKADGRPVYKTARGDTAMDAAGAWVFLHGVAKKGGVPFAAWAACEKAMQGNLDARRSIGVAAKRD